MADLDVELPEIKLPKLKEIPGATKRKLKEYRRVLNITKKPDQEEYTAISKVTGLGLLIIGAVGFAIFLVVQFGTGLI